MQRKNINHNIYRKETQKYYSARQNRDTKAGFERILTALDNLSVDDITDIKNEALESSTQHPLWSEDFKLLSEDLVNACSALDHQPALCELPDDDQAEIEALRGCLLESSENLYFWYGFKMALFLTRFQTIRLSKAFDIKEADDIINHLDLSLPEDQEIEGFDPSEVPGLFIDEA